MANPMGRRFPRKKMDEGEARFRRGLTRRMRLEWRLVHGKRMRVKVYPPAYAEGIVPEPERPTG